MKMVFHGIVLVSYVKGWINLIARSQLTRRYVKHHHYLSDTFLLMPLEFSCHESHAMLYQ